MPNFRRFVCRICGKQQKDRTDLRGFNSYKTNNKDVTLEYEDFCDRCGHKQMKNERFVMRIGNAIESGIITKQFVEDWKNKKISRQEFVDTLQRKEKEVKVC